MQANTFLLENDRPLAATFYTYIYNEEQWRTKNESNQRECDIEQTLIHATS
jgi:hypothetical protein